MTDKQFRALMDLFMCSDPYPCSGHDHVEELLDREAASRGYENWVIAFHEEG